MNLVVFVEEYGHLRALHDCLCKDCDCCGVMFRQGPPGCLFVYIPAPYQDTRAWMQRKDTGRILHLEVFPAPTGDSYIRWNPSECGMMYLHVETSWVTWTTPPISVRYRFKTPWYSVSRVFENDDEAIDWIADHTGYRLNVMRLPTLTLLEIAPDMLRSQFYLHLRHCFGDIRVSCITRTLKGLWHHEPQQLFPAKHKDVVCNDDCCDADTMIVDNDLFEDVIELLPDFEDLTKQEFAQALYQLSSE